MSVRRASTLALLPVGLGLGLVSVTTARRGPGYSLEGTGGFSTVAELAAGLALVSTGAVALLRRPASRFGALLAAAGAAWFLAEWGNPEARSSLVFTAGLALAASCPALVAHLAFAFPDGRVRDRIERGLLAVAYLDAVVVGLLATLLFDPAASGCSSCPRNLLLVHGSGGYRDLQRAGLRLGIAWIVVALALLGRRFWRATSARRRVVAPVLTAVAAYLALVAADGVHGWSRGYASNDVVDRRLWLGEAVALCALAPAVWWTWSRARRDRARLANLVVELAQSPVTGLRGLLARLLGDETLQVAYRMSDGALVDADGRPVELGGEVTRLVRGETEVALVSHRAGLLDDPGRVEEIAAVARLALEHERLQAETLAQLAALRASRARVIAVGDAERRRLERDLHDGAQQRLVALSLALRLERARLGREPGSGEEATLVEAEEELRAALAELRALAHGIFPVVLVEEGLTAAIEALAEERAIRVTALPAERLEPAVEAAAYFVVAETVKHSAGGRVTLAAARSEGRLLLDVAAPAGDVDPVALEDRIGALDGRVELTRDGDDVSIHAEIPCAS